MSIGKTRRDFLRTASIGMAMAATTRSVPIFAANPPMPAGDISAWVTEGRNRLIQRSGIRWHAASATPPTPAIVLNPEKEFQTISGFGAAFTDAACYTFNRLSPSTRESLFHKLFHPSEMGLNVCRPCIGASDYSTMVYSYDEGEPDPELKRFSIEHDRQYILPMLREARKASPDLFLFSTPWSPPGWMKAGGSMLGGSMRRHNMPAYAQYFAKFLQAY